MFNKYVAIFLVITIQFAQANEALTKDFVQKVETLTQKIQQLNTSHTIQAESFQEIFNLSNQLHDFIADNFDELLVHYSRTTMMELYTQLDAIGVFEIFAQGITTLTFKGMEPIGWKNTNELPLHPADEIIFGSKNNAQQHIDALQKTLDKSLNNYYQAAFQALVQKRFWSALEKQILFLSFAFNNLSMNPINPTEPLLLNFEVALQKFITILSEKAAILTKNLRNLNEYISEKMILQLHEDLESVYVLTIA